MITVHPWPYIDHFPLSCRVEGHYVSVEGVDKRALNLASANFLGLGGDPEMLVGGARSHMHLPCRRNSYPSSERINLQTTHPHSCGRILTAIGGSWGAPR